MVSPAGFEPTAPGLGILVELRKINLLGCKPS